jgi:hypothetical protein
MVRRQPRLIVGKGFAGDFFSHWRVLVTYNRKHNEKIPGHLDPFSRVAATWLDPIEIKEDGYYPIQPSEISSQVYMIKKNFPEGEYLYIENRQPMLW